MKPTSEEIQKIIISHRSSIPLTEDQFLNNFHFHSTVCKQCKKFKKEKPKQNINKFVESGIMEIYLFDPSCEIMKKIFNVSPD